MTGSGCVEAKAKISKTLCSNVCCTHFRCSSCNDLLDSRMDLPLSMALLACLRLHANQQFTHKDLKAGTAVGCYSLWMGPGVAVGFNAPLNRKTDFWHSTAPQEKWRALLFQIQNHNADQSCQLRCHCCIKIVSTMHAVLKKTAKYCRPIAGNTDINSKDRMACTNGSGAPYQPYSVLQKTSRRTWSKANKPHVLEWMGKLATLESGSTISHIPYQHELNQWLKRTFQYLFLVFTWATTIYLPVNRKCLQSTKKLEKAFPPR